MQIIQSIQNRIYTIRGERVMLDFDLAALYEVPTKVLNQAVKRNINRFPKDFMFRLTAAEWQVVRSQIVTAQDGPGILRSQIVTSSYGGTSCLFQNENEAGNVMNYVLQPD